MAATDPVTVAQLHEFDEIIDVRSPAEFSEDHVPGARNCPVLNDDERARVGLLYSVSPFEAKKAGAALVARNIAHHLDHAFHDRPKSWRPLIYCWRGGSRSEAFTHILRQVGWNARRLDGGYKTFRRAVVADLQTLPAKFHWRVICGPTGSGKSRLLQALAARGAQVLDLEQLAAHRGSVLGSMPDAIQPSQKMFDSRIWSALRAFDSRIDVYVESESRKIGDLRVPENLIASMWSSQCVRLDTPMATRIRLLKTEYAHFLARPSALNAQLSCLTTLYGREVIERWATLAQAGDWDKLVLELLERHYDPAYSRSTVAHYLHYDEGMKISATKIDARTFDELANSVARAARAEPLAAAFH